MSILDRPDVRAAMREHAAKGKALVKHLHRHHGDPDPRTWEGVPELAHRHLVSHFLGSDHPYEEHPA